MIYIILLIIGVLLCIGLVVLTAKLLCERYKFLSTVEDQPLDTNGTIVENKFLRHKDRKGSAYDRAMLRHRFPRKHYS